MRKRYIGVAGIKQTTAERVRDQICRTSEVRKALKGYKISNRLLKRFTRKVVVARTNMVKPMRRLRYFSVIMIIQPKYGKAMRPISTILKSLVLYPKKNIVKFWQQQFTELQVQLDQENQRIDSDKVWHESRKPN